MMKRWILMCAVFVGLCALSEPKDLSVLIGERQVVGSSQSFVYEKGVLSFPLGNLPDWIEWVEFIHGPFRQKLQRGETRTNWSLSVAQTCRFKVLAKDNLSDSERSCQFDVVDGEGGVLYVVHIEQCARSQRQCLIECGSCCRTNSSVLIMFDNCGGVLKSAEINGEDAEWSIDSSDMPEWVRFVNFKRDDHVTRLLGSNTSGGRSVNKFSGNAGAKISFVVKVDTNKTGKQRMWAFNVKDEGGRTLYSVVITQAGQ